ncbi:histidine--tRNA ligase [Microscilla marina]|uniref:Histidine--tRNA ligase n=1 Tax=Microscilla marina ATCC 23134 TaxID=313606 RepID=A1ZH83_MICM2|nr:histidine--tRNA ligase [Microscilla marina]EAY30352.1 histidyl-tRNA synthetase [Microscilla marina ATCC 23134]
MKAQKPSLPKGTRDFGPEVMAKRNYILDTIKSTFQKFGFAPLETPSIEKLSVLTGKYGDEGDQLIFKILNSGDYLGKVTQDDIDEGAKHLTPKIADKALRYDLTVPFARFVVMHRDKLAFPFKRYQIQPVWRGDRPQKGRYREFYQCDADVVGTDSLICEAEIIIMINEVLPKLGIDDFSLKINNRKVLTGIAQVIGHEERIGDICVAIDKLDKIGKDKVIEELATRGIDGAAIEKLHPFFDIKGSITEKIAKLRAIFADKAPAGLQGLDEVEQVLNYIKTMTQSAEPEKDFSLDFDITLARGLSYYTGAIFEVKVNNVQIGSISGGGRYDDLTGTFGLSGVSGVGFSFGVDRIYDVMDELNLFPANTHASVQVMFTNFDPKAEAYTLPFLPRFRNRGISCEIFPDAAKLNKQFKYANRKSIPYVVIVGEEEMKSGKLTLKNMDSGEQEALTVDEIIEKLKPIQKVV